MRLEMVQAVNWTRGKGDVVSLSVGQEIDVPESVANSWLSARLAVQAKPVPPPPVAVEAVEDHKPKTRLGGKK